MSRRKKCVPERAPQTPWVHTDNIGASTGGFFDEKIGV
jgi:hypothetical protein